MRAIPEFYPTKQGRPASIQSTGQEGLYSRYNALLEEYVEVKNLLDKLLNEMVQQQEKILIELQQMKLHLAGISDENISEEDVDA